MAIILKNIGLGKTFDKNSLNFLKSNATKALDLLRPSDPNDLINKIKGSTNNFHIYTFGGLKETNKWLIKNNYA